VDPADIPQTAKVAIPAAAHVIPSASQAPAPSRKKRKAPSQQAVPTSSQLSSVKPTIRATTTFRPIVYDDEDDEVTIIEADPVDVLYCTLSSSIVGVQYYNGEFFRIFFSHMHSLTWLSKASLVPGRKSL
jgi:SWI/SNF-related matrix-associated actin-dependent regulator of chromatin subfamily A3